MFRGNKDLKIIEKDYFDFSDISTSLTTSSNGYYSTFQGCTTLEEIQDCNFPPAYMYKTFYDCTNLRKIEKWSFSKDGGISDDVFYNCISLQEVGITGEIGNNLNLKDCYNLDKKTISSFISHLSKDASGKTLTLSEQAVMKAFESSEEAGDGLTSEDWIVVDQSKPYGWSIALL